MASAGGARRVGDAERQAVVDLLRHHTGAGRLTLDEFADRAGQVYAAVTRDDLDKVIADLPDGVRPEPGAPTAPPAAAPAPTAEGTARPRGKRRWFVAIMGGTDTRGPWDAPDEITAVAFWGGVDIDLRNARIESPVIEIEAWAIMGGIDVIVPEGIPVELSGFILMGGSSNRARSTDPIPGAPVVRVKVRGLWGGVTVRNPRRRGQRGRRHHHHGSRSADSPAELTSGSLEDRLPEYGHAEVPAPAAPAPPAPSPPPAAAAPGQSTVKMPPIPPVPPANGANMTTTLRVGGDIPAGTLTILISDITGSTQLAERLGDQAWVEVLQKHNAIVRGRIAEYGGTEVKAQGDGFLVVFPSARSAVLAAIAIQRAMADYRDRHPEQGVELRVGLHTGEVVTSDGDIFGHNVVVASRIADAAGAGEILVSRLTRDLTASASDLGFDGGEDVDLKGVSEPWRVHRVVWH